MKVTLARHAGACYGVQRALSMAEELIAMDRKVCTLGPLIHNPKVVSSLEERGVAVADSPDGPMDVALIRSHGVGPKVREALNECAEEVVDATCPHVSRAQNAAADLGREGRTVIIVGEAGHPEVEGIRAFVEEAGARACVIMRPEDIPDDLEGPIGVVVQTTQTKSNLETMMDALHARGLDPLLKDTICKATQMRQEAAQELAGQVDAMVVIGGKNSSNTTRLAQICESCCPRTFHIESADELSHLDLSEVESIGITAGASTPESQIQEVLQMLGESPEQ